MGSAFWNNMGLVRLFFYWLVTVAMREDVWGGEVKAVASTSPPAHESSCRYIIYIYIIRTYIYII
jgi:hypothetical protein